MTEIIPAILVKDIEELKLKLLEIPEEITIVHIDVLEPEIWSDISKSFEVHIMIDNPSERARFWADRKAKRIVVHKINDDILQLKKRVELGWGVEFGVTLEDVFPLMHQVDFVQLMSIAEIGEQGHPFEPKIFDRIKKVRKKFPKLPISVDGGVDTSNYQALIKAGADRLVVGSHFKDLWNSMTKK